MFSCMDIPCFVYPFISWWTVGLFYFGFMNGNILKLHKFLCSVQLLSRVRFFVTPWIAARQTSLSITNSKSLFKLMSIKSVMPSIHLILCLPLILLPSIFPSIRVFLMNQFFASGGQSIGVSASAWVLPVNIQCWFPLGLTSLISLLSKGLARVSSSTIVQRYQLFSTQPFYCPALTSVHDYWKNHSFDCHFVGKVMSLLFDMLSRFP